MCPGGSVNWCGLWLSGPLDIALISHPNAQLRSNAEELRAQVARLDAEIAP